MRKFNGFLVICVLAIAGSAANADLVIDNQSIAGIDIQSITVSPNTGDIFVTTKNGYTVTQNSTEPPPAGAVAINSFSVSPLSITEGQSVTISWTSVNATSCAASSNLVAWSGAFETNGSVGTVINTAGTYALSLTCQGEAGPVSSNATVTVTAPVVPEPKTTACTAPTLSGTTVAWRDFWKTAFPGPSYNNTNTAITKSGYLALEFNTGNVVDNGFLGTVGNTITSGTRTGAVSECPGDFDVAPECTHIWGIGSGISWATNGTSNSCELKPNTTYYFNVTFTDGSSPTSSTCTTSQCIATLQHFKR